MSKILVLLFFLAIITLQQSNEALEASIEVGQADASKLPPRVEASTISNIQGTQILSPQRLEELIPRDDWSFLDEQTLGGQSEWMHPTDIFTLYPKEHITEYTITFHTDCPKNSVILKYAATGYSFVSVNGQFVKIWGQPYPDAIHSVEIKTPQLKCGCNIIKVQVYNYDIISPVALIYQLLQTKINCYTCQNLGVTFYNRKTCSCECSSTCECNNQNMGWFGYPRCGCMCSRSLRCPPNKEFNRQKCSCDCLPRCCKKGYFQNTVSCNCIQFPVLSLPPIRLP